VLGAAVLTTGAPALAGDNAASEKEPAVVTIVPGPAGPTPAEIAKLEAVTGEAVATVLPPPAEVPPAGMPAVSPPAVEKAPEISTIVIGPAGLTPAEQAKLDAQRAPAPAPAPAPSSDAVPADEKK
jgi:hypothetical protein